MEGQGGIIPKEGADRTYRRCARANERSDRSGRRGKPLWSSGYVDLLIAFFSLARPDIFLSLRQFREHLWLPSHSSNADHWNDYPDDRRRIRRIDGRAVVGMSHVDRRIKCASWLADWRSHFDGLPAGACGRADQCAHRSADRRQLARGDVGHGHPADGRGLRHKRGQHHSAFPACS